VFGVVGHGSNEIQFGYSRLDCLMIVVMKRKQEPQLGNWLPREEKTWNSSYRCRIC